VVLAVVSLTTLALAEDFGSIAGGGGDLSGGEVVAQESSGPVNFQSAEQAMENTEPENEMEHYTYRTTGGIWLEPRDSELFAQWDDAVLTGNTTYKFGAYTFQMKDVSSQEADQIKNFISNTISTFPDNFRPDTFYVGDYSGKYSSIYPEYFEQLYNFEGNAPVLDKSNVLMQGWQPPSNEPGDPNVIDLAAGISISAIGLWPGNDPYGRMQELTFGIGSYAWATNAVPQTTKDNFKKLQAEGCAYYGSRDEFATYFSEYFKNTPREVQEFFYKPESFDPQNADDVNVLATYSLIATLPGLKHTDSQGRDATYVWGIYGDDYHVAKYEVPLKEVQGYQIPDLSSLPDLGTIQSTTPSVNIEAPKITIVD
jgi:hypothetical protein